MTKNQWTSTTLNNTVLQLCKYCYHPMRATCMERLELLDPHHRPSKYRGIISENIANNNTNYRFLDVENGAMSQDENSISITGKLTIIHQYFPNHNLQLQRRVMFHLQLDSKETFQCYYSSSRGRAVKLERLVKRHGCWILKFDWQGNREGGRGGQGGHGPPIFMPASKFWDISSRRQEEVPLADKFRYREAIQRMENWLMG